MKNDNYKPIIEMCSVRRELNAFAKIGQYLSLPLRYSYPEDHSILSFF